MSERANDLAERLELMTSAVVTAIDSSRDGEGGARVLAHHLASCHALALSLVQAVINREPLPSISWAMMHEINLQHVRANTTVGLTEALELLHGTTASTAEAIRQLTGEQLDASASWGLIAKDAAVSARSLIETRLIGHAEEHLAELMTPVGL